MSTEHICIEPRTSTTSGKRIYRVIKPGFKSDLFLTQEQMNQFISEARRLGIVNGA